MQGKKLPLFRSKVFLAPMAGITDPAFRLLCSEMGAGLCVSELTSIHSVVAREKDIKEFVGYSELERPRSVQLFGNDIELTCRAAKILEKHFDIIDFNMGCPAPHITEQMAGAALLDKPKHIRELFSKLVKSVEVPITVKLRAGIDDRNKRLFLNIAKIAEECGISMITLHARTLKQGYSGKADWALIKELKDNVKIPVVGNGDINTPEDAKKMLEETGCDYIMVGRAIMGNPFLFEQINDLLEKGSYREYTLKERLEIFSRYLNYSKEFKMKFSDIKIHAMHYTKGVVGGAEARRELGRAKSLEDIERILASKIIKDEGKL